MDADATGTASASSTAGASSSYDSESESSTCPSCPSLLDKLRAPRPSDLGRKRRIHTNPPPVGKKRSLYGTSAGKHDPKSVSPARVTEFPGEHLTVSAGKLFCNACRECLVLKRSVVASHVKSSKHAEAKKQRLQKEARERDLAQSLRAICPARGAKPFEGRSPRKMCVGDL